MNELTLFKPNELIAAIDQIQVNRTAKHLCNYFLQYAQQQLKFNNHTSNRFELKISALNEEAQIGLKDYKLIDKSLSALMQPVTIRPKDDPQKFIKLVPIYMVAVDTATGLYRYSLAPEVLDILRESDYFTKLNLHEFNLLQSKHSLVLYEWLKRYKTASKIPQLSIDDLRQITGTAEKKTYDNFTNLKRTVLDIAVAEITEKTPYTVTYEPIRTPSKTRPKVTAVQFAFSRKTPETPGTPKHEAQQSTATATVVSGALAKLLSPELHIYTTDEAGNKVDIDALYRGLVTDLQRYNFSSKTTESYRATYDFSYAYLTQFVSQKKQYRTKDKLSKWLLNDEDRRKTCHRPPYCADLLMRLINTTIDSSDDVSATRQTLLLAQSHLGYASLIERLRRHLGETNQIDLFKYL